jgi:hypothetical protein
MHRRRRPSHLVRPFTCLFGALMYSCQCYSKSYGQRNIGSQLPRNRHGFDHRCFCPFRSSLAAYPCSYPTGSREATSQGLSIQGVVDCVGLAGSSSLSLLFVLGLTDYSTRVKSLAGLVSSSMTSYVLHSIVRSPSPVTNFEAFLATTKI